MPNYKIFIQYDGTEYSGWQSQPNGNTIQDKITKAISQIIQKDENLIASGRTDAGVHAFGQIANFRTEKILNENKIMHSLNSLLPLDISISNLIKVDDKFHSRFDAKSRKYIYLISKQKSAFYSKYSYQYPFVHNLNFNKLQNISKSLIGEHDFTSFCKTKTDTENKICNISSIQWKNTKGFLVFMIEANRFLHGMVRTIVGTILNANQKQMNSDYLLDVLNTKNRETAGESVPAKGLFLYKVKY